MLITILYKNPKDGQLKDKGACVDSLNACLGRESKEKVYSDNYTPNTCFTQSSNRGICVDSISADKPHGHNVGVGAKGKGISGDRLNACQGTDMENKTGATNSVHTPNMCHPSLKPDDNPT